MKRKRNTRKDHTAPAWQSIPMEDILVLVKGWEKLKVMRGAMQSEPLDLANLSPIEVQQVMRKQIMAAKLGEIGPAARANVEAWLKSPEQSPTRYVVIDDAEKSVLSIVVLWEGLLAIGEIAPEAKPRWLEMLPSEARLLLGRLSRQVLRKPL